MGLPPFVSLRSTETRGLIPLKDKTPLKHCFITEFRLIIVECQHEYNAKILRMQVYAIGVRYKFFR